MRSMSQEVKRIVGQSASIVPINTELEVKEAANRFQRQDTSTQKGEIRATSLADDVLSHSAGPSYLITFSFRNKVHGLYPVN